VYGPAGLPQVSDVSHRLPDDLRLFYELCGGVVLFEHAPYPTFVSRPGEMVPANPVIAGAHYSDDISSSWYLIASDGTRDQRMTIDLDPSRLGRCYDSFWDRHAVAGASTIIAGSFSAFLQHSLRAAGQSLYWLQPDFVPIGDAYD
jgi:hypothetical protein